MEPSSGHLSIAGRSPDTDISRLTIRWFESLEEIEGLQEPWTQLESCARKRTVFARWRFRVTWYRNLIDHGEQPLCGTAWDGDRLVGVAPMVRRRGRLHGIPMQRVEFSGHQFAQGEFLVHDEHPGAAERIFASLLDEVSPDAGTIIGPDMRSPDLARLSTIASRRRFKFVAQPHHYAVVGLDSGYDSYFASLKSAFRRNVRSRDRKLEALGATVETFGDDARDPEVIRLAVERMVSIIDSSWRADNGEELPELWRSVYADIAETFAAEGNLRLEFLVVDGRDAAFFYSLVDGGVLYDITIGYDNDFKLLSPGTVLMQRLLKRYAAEGITTVVSQGPYPYKRRWSTNKVEESIARFFAPTFRGRLSYLSHVHLMPWVKKRRRNNSRWKEADRR